VFFLLLLVTSGCSGGSSGTAGGEGTPAADPTVTVKPGRWRVCSYYAEHHELDETALVDVTLEGDVLTGTLHGLVDGAARRGWRGPLDPTTREWDAKPFGPDDPSQFITYEQLITFSLSGDHFTNASTAEALVAAVDDGAFVCPATAG
jgi:hypothetical protein